MFVVVAVVGTSSMSVFFVQRLMYVYLNVISIDIISLTRW